MPPTTSPPAHSKPQLRPPAPENKSMAVSVTYPPPRQNHTCVSLFAGPAAGEPPRTGAPRVGAPSDALDPSPCSGANRLALPLLSQHLDDTEGSRWRLRSVGMM